jgi:tRNA modification GTPase
MLASTDTIVAISTPPGRGGIGVVRLSGSKAEGIARLLLGLAAPLQPRRATFGRAHEAGASSAHEIVLDQVVCTWFPSPGSYTGEDVVEISGHGNPVVLGGIVQRAVDAGARLAEPGEFTLRAFLHGKLDLIQAEAVADLIEAVTPAQARAACDQLEGTLTETIAEIEETLFDVEVRLEASLDFPEDGYEFIGRDALTDRLEQLQARVGAILETGRRGRLIREGRQVVIAGRPNAGKSSLFNALLGVDRAIVHDGPGTTRDLLTERCDIGGVPVTLVDTAGVGPAEDLVERQGVARARGAAGVADLVLVVLDGAAPLDTAVADLAAIAPAGRPRLVAVSKADLTRTWRADELDSGGAPVLVVSAKTGTGLQALRSALSGQLVETERRRDEILVSNQRHLALLERCREAIARAVRAVREGGSEEFVVADVAEARGALQEVTGKRAADAVLREIFGRFCIGK